MLSRILENQYVHVNCEDILDTYDVFRLLQFYYCIVRYIHNKYRTSNNILFVSPSFCSTNIYLQYIYMLLFQHSFNNYMF